ncbi:MAG: Asp-tRNA(Asn)/Glu-tRNA(Gln) amidotransferase subunit GatC [Chitinophagaceae bacterium]
MFSTFAPMEVNDALVEKLAKLSALYFSDAEKLQIQEDLQQMISFVEKLNELDTEDVEPLLYITEAENVFREDEIGEMISNEAALQNAAGTVPPYFTAPKAVQKPGTKN